MGLFDVIQKGLDALEAKEDRRRDNLKEGMGNIKERVSKVKSIQEERKDLKKQEAEIENLKERVSTQDVYYKEMKSLLDSLSDLDKKYVHLSPPLESPRSEDGSIDYSQMDKAYNKHLLGVKETVFAISCFSRIPRMINDVAKHVKKDSRRLSKEDYLAIRKVIISQLDELEKLCNDDYDYVSGIKSFKDTCDINLKEVDDELSKLVEKQSSIKNSNIFN